MEGCAEKYNNITKLATMPIKMPYSKPRKTPMTNVRFITKKSISKKFYRCLHITIIFQNKIKLILYDISSMIYLVYFCIISIFLSHSLLSLFSIFCRRISGTPIGEKNLGLFSLNFDDFFCENNNI